jgi:hypothetical protein
MHGVETPLSKLNITVGKEVGVRLEKPLDIILIMAVISNK